MKKVSLALLALSALSLSTFANVFEGKVTINSGEYSASELESFMAENAADIQACTAKFPSGTNANIVFEVNPGKRTKVRISGNRPGYRMKLAAKCLLGTSQAWDIEKPVSFTYSDNF